MSLTNVCHVRARDACSWNFQWWLNLAFVESVQRKVNVSSWMDVVCVCFDECLWVFWLINRGSCFDWFRNGDRLIFGICLLYLKLHVDDCCRFKSVFLVYLFRWCSYFWDSPGNLFEEHFSVPLSPYVGCQWCQKIFLILLQTLILESHKSQK